MDDPFVRSGLTKVIISHGVTDISNTFSECASLETVILPDTVTKMDNSFYGCTSLLSITIPKGVTTMDAAFMDCTALKQVIVSDGVVSMNDAFYDCVSLETIEIPNSVVTMNEAFRNCTALKEAIVPDSVVEMEFAFFGCSALTSGNVPKAVTAANYAFYDCTSLETFRFAADASKMSEYTLLFDWNNTPLLTDFYFDGTHAQLIQAKEYLPNLRVGSATVLRCTDSYCEPGSDFVHETLDLYQYRCDDTYHWKYGDCHCNSAQEVHTFKDGACTECEMPKPSEGLNVATDGQNCHVLGIGTCADPNITLYFQARNRGQNNSLVIEKSAFENNTFIRSIQTIENDLYWSRYQDRPTFTLFLCIEIRERAFAGCTSLETVLLCPTSILQGKYIFSNCASLKEITLSDYYLFESLYIPAYTFNECSSLTSVTIPKNYHYIDEGAFFNCTSLTDIYYQDSMAAWEATYKDETEYDPITGEITQYAWDYGTGDYVVHCTDGDIYKNAT
jgi:hypothetical protein